MQSPDIPTVQTSAGTFQGFVADGCRQFLGIRYATSERYAPPVPYTYGDAKHLCTTPAPFPVQLPSAIERTLGVTARGELPVSFFRRS